MTQRVVLGASAVLFGLLAMIAHLMADMHDRAFPVALAPSGSVHLDFAEATIKDEAAFDALKSWDARAGLGLLKESADLTGDLRGKVFIALNESSTLPETIDWYGEEPIARVVSPVALAHALPSGTYLVTGRADELTAFVGDLRRQGVVVSPTSATLTRDLQGLFQLQSLAIAFATGCVLLVTLVLYWLATKSRDRALRILGGTPVAQVQFADITRFVLLISAAWGVTTTTTVVAIGIWKGWEYTPLYASRMAALGVLTLLLVLVAAAVISWVSTPSAESIAQRKPASLGVRRAAGGVKAVTFVLVLLAIGPAWLGITRASATADELSQWKNLADQVRVAFKGVSEDDFKRLMPPFGAMVQEAEAAKSVALCNLFVDDPAAVTRGERWADSLGRWSGFALTNQRWLDLMTQSSGGTLSEIPQADLPKQFLDVFASQLDLWKRSPEPTQTVLSGFRFLTPHDKAIPLAATGGELKFRRDVLIVVAPDTWKTFNDSFLVSTASSGNLIFTGLEPTQVLIESHQIGTAVKVRHAAADGILRAQFAAYDAWLGVISMIGLAVALVVSSAISAYISALLEARNDFARRLAGYAWPHVLKGRLGPETAVGALIAVAMLFVQPSDHAVPVGLTAVLLLTLAPAAHVLAARQAFADVSARRL